MSCVIPLCVIRAPLLVALPLSQTYHYSCYQYLIRCPCLLSGMYPQKFPKKGYMESTFFIIMYVWKCLYCTHRWIKAWQHTELLVENVLLQVLRIIFSFRDYY